jgi:hypothetical protein
MVPFHYHHNSSEWIAPGHHGSCAGSGGILKLHEDVQTCGYKDVQVMFDMLTSELEAAQAQKPSPSPPCKQALPPVWPGRSSSTIAAAPVQ